MKTRNQFSVIFHKYVYFINFKITQHFIIFLFIIIINSIKLKEKHTIYLELS